MITICIREPQRGNEMSAQGAALGTWCTSILRPERATELKQKSILLPFQGEIYDCLRTQGAQWSLHPLRFPRFAGDGNPGLTYSGPFRALFTSETSMK